MHLLRKGVFLSFVIFGLHLLPLITNGQNPLFDPLDNPMTREKYRQYYCFKFKICEGRGKMVCGFDELRLYLATFEDICTMYRMNCQGRGLFKLVDLEDCEAQMKFQLEHNETWQFEHLDRSLIINQTDYTLLTAGNNKGNRGIRFKRKKNTNNNATSKLE